MKKPGLHRYLNWLFPPFHESFSFFFLFGNHCRNIRTNFSLSLVFVKFRIVMVERYKFSEREVCDVFEPCFACLYSYSPFLYLFLLLVLLHLGSLLVCNMFPYIILSLLELCFLSLLIALIKDRRKIFNTLYTLDILTNYL